LSPKYKALWESFLASPGVIDDATDDGKLNSIKRLWIQWMIYYLLWLH